MSEQINEELYPSGAEWRQWDLHIHSPASFHWDGQHFEAQQDSTANIALIDQMIGALNEAEPAVFALMDYWTFDGWFALKRRLKQADAPKLKKKIFPGIELRLVSPTTCRLNAHVLFSDEIEDQALRDFKAGLKVEIVKRPLSDEALIQLARQVGESFLKTHHFKHELVMKDDCEALRVGSSIAEIECASYRDAISAVPDGMAIGFMPYDTSDGLNEVKWQDHYAYFLSLFSSSPIFESRNPDLRGAFVNEETDKNKGWIKHFQESLGNVPRLVVSGSDAHRFVGTKGNNDRRGYGDYPSGKITWIKADPTFRGLQQAIKEPAKRSFIGERPPKLTEVDQNKTFFLDSVKITRNDGAESVGHWLHGNDIKLNSDLIAIIGNKGSGKSALADIIALLGNSKQRGHFSFLKKDRFRGRSGEPAKHFIGTVTWRDGSIETRNLNDDPPSDRVELVRYIPQGHFEGLCNDHISGKTNAFERELRNVIFSHTDETQRLGALDFEELIERQESNFRDRLNEARKDLKRLNQEIVACEERLRPETIKEFQELLLLRKKQIEEHTKLKPSPEEKPSDKLTDSQLAASNRLDQILREEKELEIAETKQKSADALEAGKARAVQNIRERVRLLEKAHRQFIQDTESEVSQLDLKIKDIVDIKIDLKGLDAVQQEIEEQQKVGRLKSQETITKRLHFANEKPKLNALLNEPQLKYQTSLLQAEDWEKKQKELIGSVDNPESLRGIEARITQIQSLPKILAEKEALRVKVTEDIFDILDEQRKARELLFKPVHDLIQADTLIREEYKLQFQATLGCQADAICAALFNIIKQNVGELRGEDESYAAIRRICDKYDLNIKEDTVKFIQEVYLLLTASSKMIQKDVPGVAALLRKDRNAIEVYDLIFGLLFLEPRYTLRFQGAQIEQLSPGQRGALLLIFYLLVDKGRNPIILDQPEENLDNETVVSLLVPVLTKSKKTRQIIMVTHNPNLAVVCDAEQVILSTFDRQEDSRIAYVSGSIEWPVINSHVVKVLEGTKPAFDNRRIKYH